MQSYITRKKVGKIFKYYFKDAEITDTSHIERLNKLAIPPAWSDVKIAKAISAKVQAEGFDSAGRKQAIYSQKYRKQQEKLKFDRILRFAQHLPSLRKQVTKDLARKKLGKEKVVACIVKLIDEAYFRVGNDKYARENQSYGVTTLRSKHTKVTTNTITFHFTGKSGQEHIKKIKDSKLARIVKQLDELPGHEIFRYQDEAGKMHDLHPSDVNAYIKQHMGEEFTAKDFRTWGGTLLAATEILRNELEASATQTQRKKAVTKIVKQVAKRLGNTPAIARQSYIDPRIFIAFEDEVKLSKVRKSITKMRPRKYLSVDEQCVLEILA